MSKLETILSNPEISRSELFAQLDEDTYQAYARRADVSPDNKEKNPDGFVRRRCTCDDCPQPFPWLSRTEIEERGGNHPIREIGEGFEMKQITDGEWIEWGSISSWQAWKNAQVQVDYFYTTRCTPCDSKNRRVSRAQQRIDDVTRAVGYNKFVTLTKPRLVLGTVPTNTKIQESMKEIGKLMRRRLSSRRVMLKKAIGPSTFGFYWLECVVRAYQDDNLEEEVDHDDPNAKAWTLHPHIHAVWSSSKKKWNLNIFRDWWSPSDDNENWRNNVVPYSAGQVADYVNKKSINQTMVEYANKQATYWDKGFRTCNRFGSWSPSSKSRRRISRHHREELFKGEKLTKRELKEYDSQYELARTSEGWLFKSEHKRLNCGFPPLLSSRESYQ